MYAKLFASLYQGTLRGCSDEILVFTNLLAHADSGGVVDKHWRAIAEETGLSRERVEAAIATLEAPDPESRSPDEEGRRIVLIDEHRAWGWRIVNHGKYRAIRNEADRQEQNRMAQARWREKNKQDKPRKPPSAQAEAEANTEAEVKDAPAASSGRAPSAPDPAPLPDFLGDSNAEAFKTNARPRIARGWELPESWGIDAEALGWTGDAILKEAEKFRQYWTSGKGAGTRRTIKGWRQSWSNWLAKAEMQRNRT